MMGPCLLLLSKAATKVVRARSDQGLRCKDRDQSEETEDQVLISAITFCRHQHSITIVLQSQKLAFSVRVWLCKTTVIIRLLCKLKNN